MLTETSAPKRDGLDTAIKVLTIIKLLFQLAFYGLLIGATVWFLLDNPLPKMIEAMQAQLIGSFMPK